MLPYHCAGYTPLPGYERRYLINEQGRVLILSKGHRGKLLTQRTDARSGYLSVKLYKDDEDSTQAFKTRCVQICVCGRMDC
jgi:hypothetical protein